MKMTNGKLQTTNYRRPTSPNALRTGLSTEGNITEGNIGNLADIGGQNL